MASNKTLITVAGTGAEITKDDFPALPTTLDELVDTGKRIEAAGAAMIHVHVRDENHEPTLDVERLKDTVTALRESTGLVIQLSTGGSITDPLENRIKVLEARPDSCSLSCGTMNFGDGVFSNPYGFMADLFEAAREAQVVPEFEIFDVGQAHSLARLLRDKGLPFGGKVHCDFVLGVPGGMNGTPEALAFIVSQLPAEVTSWSATGIGRAHLPIMATACAMGGHLRVGMEDNTFFAYKQPVEHNDQLVQRAAELANLMQRPPMTPTECREMLGCRPL